MQIKEVMQWQIIAKAAYDKAMWTQRTILTHGGTKAKKSAAAKALATMRLGRFSRPNGMD